MAGPGRFDDKAMRAGTKAAGSPGWPQEATMSCGRKHWSRQWFATKVFIILTATVVAAYVTASLL